MKFQDISLTLETLPEDFKPYQLRLLTRESLDRIEWKKMRWECQCKGCKNGTFVRDYGTSPWFFLDRNSKTSQENPLKYWFNLQKNYWLCGKHNKFFSRLKKAGFDYQTIYFRLVDTQKMQPINPEA